MSLGALELVIFLFFVAIAVAVMLILKNNKNSKLLNYLLFGIAGIFLTVGLITPPDIISTFILAIPAIIIYSLIIALKVKK